MDASDELLGLVREILDLLRPMAEPAIAQRDEKLRTELRRIVGSSAQRAKAALAMRGTMTQKLICEQIKMTPGNMSTFVKNLAESKLLTGDLKQPKLAISIQFNFFEASEGHK